MRSLQQIAQRPLPKSHPRNRPSGATTKDARAPLPGWLWLAAGLGAGILITSLVKLSSSHPAQIAAQTSAPLTTAAQPSKPQTSVAPEPEVKATGAALTDKADKTDKTESKPATQFDFYTLLPEQEVIEPTERTEQSRIRSGKETKDAKAPAAATATATGNDAAPDEEFILQAGSFRSAQEAERRRAQVQTLGFPTRQESVSAGGDTWYRVLVGPFTSRNAVTAARDKLASQHIDTIMVRKKTAG